MVAEEAQIPLLQGNRHQGYFGEAYVASIAAAAGLDVLLPRLGDGQDLTVFTPGPKGTSSSRQISLQVKSWSEPEPVCSDGCFHYPLKGSAYNYLAGNDHDVMHFLVLFIAPRNPAQYASAHHARLHLRHAAYWLSLKDRQADIKLSDESTKTVYVPRRNLITPTTIRALVEHREEMAVVP